MKLPKLNTFEVILLVVGLAAGFLGFHLIKVAVQGQINWLMVLSIFNWWMLLVLFVSLSLSVEISKSQLAETKKIIKRLETEIFSKNKKKSKKD